MGKLANPLSAAAEHTPHLAARPLRRLSESVFGAALRASFEPVVNEPIPDRLQEMIDMIRIEEQKQRGQRS